jgi:dolichyl-phosphate beta-glucosyltransferase
MTRPVDLSIVIPAFNEAGRIGGSLELLREQLPDNIRWEILVVDDGSTDDTASIVSRSAAVDSRVRLVREAHRGKGGALRAGLLGAVGERRFMCDADLSMPVSDLRRFLAELPANCDIAIGTREGLGARRIGEPFYRHLTGRLFNWLVRATALSGITDTQCGFKMFTASAVDGVFPWITIDGWAVDIEILVIARLRGLRVKEIPVEWHYREQSQVSLVRDGIRMARDVWRIHLNAARGRYDVHVGSR